MHKLAVYDVFILLIFRCHLFLMSNINYLTFRNKYCTFLWHLRVGGRRSARIKINLKASPN